MQRDERCKRMQEAVPGSAGPPRLVPSQIVSTDNRDAEMARNEEIMNTQWRERSELGLAREGNTSLVEKAEDLGRAERPAKRSVFFEGWLSALRFELRTHAFGYSVLGAFVLVGPIATHFMFPDAPAGAGVVGGFAFGIYAALCAVPGKFL